MWIGLEALLSQNVSFPPRAATPGTLQTLPGAEREASLFPSKPFNWKAKKKNSTNKNQSKGFLLFEGQEGEQPGQGWTCRKLSGDPDPAGLEQEHFPDELSLAAAE